MGLKSHRHVHVLLENSVKSYLRVGAESCLAWNDTSQAAKKSWRVCWVVPSMRDDRNWKLFEEQDKWPPPLENKQKKNLEFKLNASNFESGAPCITSSPNI